MRGLLRRAEPHDTDRITVLNYGQVLAEGTPAEIRGNAEVRRVYLRD
jgi:ABC-type branched-subunit amino acid transport system ATPase component